MRRAVFAVTIASALVALPGAASAAIQVANAKSMPGVEGQEIAHQRIVSFDDAGACDAGAYTVTIDWGDGQTSAGQIVKALKSSPAFCSYDAEGSHVYAQAGSYPVTATITRGADTATTPVAGVATIAAAQLAVEPAAAPAAPAPAATAGRTADAPAAAPAPAALPTTPALRVLGPVRLSALRRDGLRIRTGAAGAGRRLTVLVKRGLRTIATAHVQGSAGTVRVRFAKAELARLRHGRRYGLVIPGGAGVPSLGTSFRVG